MQDEAGVLPVQDGEADVTVAFWGVSIGEADAGEVGGSEGVEEWVDGWEGGGDEGKGVREG